MARSRSRAGVYFANNSEVAEVFAVEGVLANEAETFLKSR